MARYFYINQPVWRNPDNCPGVVLFTEEDSNSDILIEWENGFKKLYGSKGEDEIGVVIVSQKPIQPIVNLDLGDWEIGDTISCRYAGERHIDTIKEFKFDEASFSFITHTGKVVRESMSKKVTQPNFTKGEMVIATDNFGCKVFAIFDCFCGDLVRVTTANGFKEYYASIEKIV